MKSILIYTLSDPRDGLIKYVGKTSQKLKKRLCAHIAESKKSKTKKSNWINYLIENNLKPIIDELDQVPENKWEFWEKYWISQFKCWGINLKNGNEGGKGQSSDFMKKNNPMFKEEYRKKVSTSLIGNTFAKGFVHTEETKRKVSNNNAKYWLNKKRDKNTIEKMRIANKGKKLSDETKKLISENCKGDKNHFYGKHLSDVAKKSISEAQMKKVKVIFLQNDFIKIFNSLNECALELNIARETIGRIIKSNKVLKKQNCKFEFL